MSVLSNYIHANQHYNQAIDALEAHDDQRSLTEFNRTLRINPRYTLAYINRGKLYQQRLSKPELAIADYERALKLDPRDNQTRFRLAELDRRLHRYQASVHHYRRIAVNVKWNHRALAHQADRAVQRDDFKRASELMARLLRQLDFH